MAPVYATPSDLASYLDTAQPPPGAARLLTEASRLVDLLLIGAVYRTDDQGAPVVPAVVDALSDATVQQAAYWHENGEPLHGGGDTYSSVKIGNVSLSGGTEQGAGSAAGMVIAPGLAATLQLAGLTPAYIQPLG